MCPLALLDEAALAHLPKHLSLEPSHLLAKLRVSSMSWMFSSLNCVTKLSI
jgi:hypothetical protein